MFTGIIEAIGTVVNLDKKDSSLLITVQSSLSGMLKPGQSAAHNGACLTVIRADKTTHTVEAVSETLRRTNLGRLKRGSHLNLERAMKADGRFEGHFVQGHIDQCGKCMSIEDLNGSRKFWFSFKRGDFLVAEKGSVCVDGVSLTVVDAGRNTFSVVVTPYTLKHTCFRYLRKGGPVNLEFDILGKYVVESMRQHEHRTLKL